jgi:DNA-binding NtrC family response regulator
VSQTTQIKLLRVLDTSTFRHVGGTIEIRVDVRVLAATNRDLAGLIRQGVFREDLYYRLSTITIDLPPLRERRSDIDLLAEHFVALLNERYGLQRRIGPEALKLLRDHDWPGNVRELLHAVESSMIVCEGPEVSPEHLPPALRAQARSADADHTIDGHTPSLLELERAHIQRVLRETGGHRGNAARLLGISERNLYRKLREHGLLTS